MLLHLSIVACGLPVRLKCLFLIWIRTKVPLKRGVHVATFRGVGSFVQDEHIAIAQDPLFQVRMTPSRKIIEALVVLEWL